MISEVRLEISVFLTLSLLMTAQSWSSLRLAGWFLAQLFQVRGLPETTSTHCPS